MQERNSDKDTQNVFFEIKGAYYKEKTFPSLNVLLLEAERHPIAYNRMKKQFEMIAISCIRRDLRQWKPTGIVIPHYIFCEPIKGKKRDYDNISSAARKIINDALVKSHYLVDDNPSYLEYGTNEFIYDDEPFIRVELECKTNL